MRCLQRIRSLHKGERGDSLIEFAISAIVVFTLLFGIMEFARAMYIYHFVSYAAQAGARYAIVRGSTWSAPCSGKTSTGSNLDCYASSSDVTTYIQGIAPSAVDTSQLTVTPTWPGTVGGSSGATCADTKSKTNDNNPGCVVQVQVQYKFHFILPFMPGTSPTFSATAQQVIQE